MDIVGVRQRVARRFPDVEQLSDTVLRFVRRHDGMPFAVYYLDVADDMPDSPARLTDYVDRVVGSRYFEGEKSLQWSNYLYFVAPRDKIAASDTHRVQELIENDRRYARKRVVAEDELDAILDESMVEASGGGPGESILSTWVDRLVDAGIDDAIFCEADLPRRLELIESSSESVRPTRKPLARDVKTPSALGSLDLVGYRPYPTLRHYEFAGVNLVAGANGSGKTSLLEAIELVYCGRTRRNPDQRPKYELSAVFEDGSAFVATHRRTAAGFRACNLAWYGQREIRTNRLCESFARYNFLDADAAVSLSSEPSRVEEDLTKLLVGPDAARAWQDMERVRDAVRQRLRGREAEQTRAIDELAYVDKTLSVSDVTAESDSLGRTLRAMVEPLGWTSALTDTAACADELVKATSELVSAAEMTVSADWLEPPASLKSLNRFCDVVQQVTGSIGPAVTRLETLCSNQQRLEDSLEVHAEALKLVREATRLVEAGVARRQDELTRLEASLNTRVAWVTGLGLGALANTEHARLTVDELCGVARTARIAAEDSLAAARDEYGVFRKARDQSFGFASELREVAARIIETTDGADECPLCHTRFDVGELEKRMQEHVDGALEATAQEMLLRLRAEEDSAQKARARERAADSLREFCQRADLSKDAPTSKALAEVEHVRHQIAADQDSVELLVAELGALASRGLSSARLDEVLSQLGQLGHELPEPTGDGLRDLHSELEEALETARSSLEGEKRQAGEVRGTVDALLLDAGLGGVEPAVGLSLLKEKQTRSEALQDRLHAQMTSFSWSESKPLTEVALDARTARQTAIDLKAALVNERMEKAARSEASVRRGKLTKQLEDMRRPIERLQESFDALKRIQEEFSLSEALDSSLRQNRASVEAIFSRIHAPAEFSGLGSNWETLVRRLGGEEAKLSEISSGQRAAFALAVFLAQNAQVRTAPPVILIDDPVAHVDDLNTLSFLDYLREIALTGTRQIFFATASDKLAALFGRKFDFLGDGGFRRFDLSRGASERLL